MYVHVRICVPVCVLVGVHVSMSLYGHVGAGGVEERGTCMKYLPGRQILLPDTRFQAFLSPSRDSLGNSNSWGLLLPQPDSQKAQHSVSVHSHEMVPASGKQSCM